MKIRGWQTGSGHSLAAAIRRVEELGLFQVLLTDISRDGTGNGPNVPLYAQWARRCPDLRITASGGVRDAADLVPRRRRPAGTRRRRGTGASPSNPALLESLQSVAFRSAKEASFRGAKGDDSALCRGPKGDDPALFPEAKGDMPHDAGSGLAVRVIPCLDVTDGRVVKGTNFEGLRDAGDPVELARRYCDEGADELVFLDITATSGRRQTAADLALRVAEAVNIPFTIGGGVRGVQDAKTLLDAGADKVSVNSAAIADPRLLETLARELGTANVVLRHRRALPGRRLDGPGPRRPRRCAAGAVAWAEEAVARGAGELLLTSHDRDGTLAGFDTALLSEVKRRVSVPVIASGGGGTPSRLSRPSATAKRMPCWLPVSSTTVLSRSAT